MTDVRVLVDLGRSHVRAVVDDVEYVAEPGAGIGDSSGSHAAVAVVADAVRAVLARTGGEARDGGWQLAVAAPGVAGAPDLAAAAATALGAAFDPAPSTVLLVSDSAAWQVGAFDGRDGAVVALGTGAVVVARDRGTVRRYDGLGLLLGDVGGGAWTGRAALQRAAVTTGPLHRAAVARYGPVGRWAAMAERTDVPAYVATFAPDVVRLASTGDSDAGAVLALAARGVEGTLSLVPEDLPVALTGGFANVLAGRLQAAMPGRTWVQPVGDVISGLRILLDHPGPFATEIVRVERDSLAAVPTPHDTDTLPTEAVAPDTGDLDVRPTADLVARLVDGHAPAVRAARLAVPALARAADLAGAALTGSGRLVYVGAGTPGRLALQDAAELTPTFGLDPARAVVLLAGGAAAGERAVENAEDDTAGGAADVDAAGVGSEDVVIAVSASGRTPYVLAAAERAQERGAVVVGISSVPGSPLSTRADVAVDLLTGPEVLAGSTRLAAGTAQKIALNTLSTAALVRAGATYGPWMVDVLATNDKLRRRAVRIVRDAAGVDEQVAADSLAAADGSVPVALVMVLAGLDVGPARERLAVAGSVRGALGTVS